MPPLAVARFRARLRVRRIQRFRDAGSGWATGKIEPRSGTPRVAGTHEDRAK
jgi:hypothetical protein